MDWFLYDNSLRLERVNYDQYKSYEALFLFGVGMSKLLFSFGFGFNSAFYGTFYFVKDPIKTEHNTLSFD